MKITLTHPKTEVKRSMAVNITHGRFFRALSTTYPEMNNVVFIKLGDDVYRLNTDQYRLGLDELIVHCGGNNTSMIFTDIHYLDVELICTDAAC